MGGEFIEQPETIPRLVIVGLRALLQCPMNALKNNKKSVLFRIFLSRQQASQLLSKPLVDAL